MSYSTPVRASNPIYMRRKEVIVHHVDGDHLYAYADMLAYSKHWPETIEHDCQTYQYVCNEIMTDEAVGNYSGHSKYIRSSVVPPQGGVVMTEALAAWLRAMQVKPEVIHALRLTMLNATEKQISAYTYAHAMERSAKLFGLDGVRVQADYLLLWMASWHGAQARECKDILRKWTKV